jgi:putative Holliday junction resolvase
MIFSDFAQSPQILPKTGRLLALDVGTKRIGLAISDQSRFIATPKLILSRQSNQKDFIKIRDFIEENQVVGIIIGLPVNLDGSAIAMTEFAKKFAENFDQFLEEKFPIFFFDERLSSSEARSFNASELSRKNNKFVDDIAASLILQHFLDSVAQI